MTYILDVQKKLGFTLAPDERCRAGLRNILFYPKTSCCPMPKSCASFLTVRGTVNEEERITNFSLSTPWGRTGGAEVQLHSFWTSALHGGDWWAYATMALSPGKNPGTHWKGGWIGPRADRAVLEKRKLSQITKPFAVSLSPSPFSATLLPNINLCTSFLIQSRDCNPNQTLDDRREIFRFTWLTP